MTESANTDSAVATIAHYGEVATADEKRFELIQRKAQALSSSGLVPKEYQGNAANCMIALELAERTQSSAFMVMQNVHIIQGRPSWSSQFIIGALNSCGRFSPIRYRKTGALGTPERAYTAHAIDLSTGEEVEGPPVSLRMAKEEGWSTKNGSKWKTMPELMLSYRSAAFFGRLYAPDVLMGMHTSDEVQDFATPAAPGAAAAIESLGSAAIDVTPPAAGANGEADAGANDEDTPTTVHDEEPPDDWNPLGDRAAS